MNTRTRYLRQFNSLANKYTFTNMTNPDAITWQHLTRKAFITRHLSIYYTLSDDMTITVTSTRKYR